MMNSPVAAPMAALRIPSIRFTRDCPGVLNRFREFVHLRCRPLIVAIGTAGETACPTLLDQSFGELGGAGGFACRRKLISRKRLCTPWIGCLSVLGNLTSGCPTSQSPKTDFG